MANWVFDKAAFIAIFPEFVNISDAQFTFYAAEATNMLNTAKYGITDGGFINVLYSKLLAHILALAQRGANGAAGQLINASEGSVSVGFQGLNRLSGSWFNQTVYGANFWQLIRPYLSPRYISGR